MVEEKKNRVGAVQAPPPQRIQSLDDAAKLIEAAQVPGGGTHLTIEPPGVLHRAADSAFQSQEHRLIHDLDPNAEFPSNMKSPQAVGQPLGAPALDTRLMTGAPAQVASLRAADAALSVPPPPKAPQPPETAPPTAKPPASGAVAPPRDVAAAPGAAPPQSPAESALYFLKNLYATREAPVQPDTVSRLISGSVDRAFKLPGGTVLNAGGLPIGGEGGYAAAATSGNQNIWSSAKTVQPGQADMMSLFKSIEAQIPAELQGQVQYMGDPSRLLDENGRVTPEGMQEIRDAKSREEGAAREKEAALDVRRAENDTQRQYIGRNTYNVVPNEARIRAATDRYAGAVQTAEGAAGRGVERSRMDQVAREAERDRSLKAIEGRFTRDSEEYRAALKVFGDLASIDAEGGQERQNIAARGGEERQNIAARGGEERQTEEVKGRNAVRTAREAATADWSEDITARKERVAAAAREDKDERTTPAQRAEATNKWYEQFDAALGDEERISQLIDRLGAAAASGDPLAAATVRTMMKDEKGMRKRFEQFVK